MSEITIKRALCAITLLVASPALAQDGEPPDDMSCADDGDCAEGERCDKPVPLVFDCDAERDEECVGEPGPPPERGYCVPQAFDQACQQDADCGDTRLECITWELEILCPADEPDCADGRGANQGICGFPLPDDAGIMTLEATSDLAAQSGPAEAQDGEVQAEGAAGNGAIAEASAADGPTAPEDGTRGKSSSSSCSVAAASPAHAFTLGWLALSVLALRRRRRSLDRFSQHELG